MAKFESVIPEPVAAFRREYRGVNVGAHYSGRAHLAFTVCFSLAAIVLCGLALEAVRPLEWLTVPLTFLYANLVEYFGHRVPMHRRVRGLGLVHRRHALEHHRYFTAQAMQFESSDDFKAVLFPIYMILFYLLAFALPVGLALAWLLTANVALLFVMTAVAYFLSYEILHFSYHVPPDAWIGRLALVRRLRRLHATHHRPELMNKRNFNITWPIGDWLFGTLHRD